MSRERSRIARRGAFVAGLGVAASLAFPRTASAQSDAQFAARRGLLEQAQAARASGDHVRALDLSQRAGQLAMTPSVRLFIAEELNALGRTAAALGASELCVRDADRDLQLRDRANIQRRCRALADLTRERVGYLTVTLGPGISGARIVVAGEALPDALVGVPSVVTPGDVTVEASTAGSPTSRLVVHVEPRGTSSAEVRVVPPGIAALVDTTARAVAVTPVPAPAPAPAPRPVVAVPVTPPPPRPVAPPPRVVVAVPAPVPVAPVPAPAPRVVVAPTFTAVPARPIVRPPVARTVPDAPRGTTVPGAVTVSLGGASMVTTAVLWGVGASWRGACDTTTATPTCPDTETTARFRDAATLGTVGTVTLVVGGALVVTGAVLLALPHPAHAAANAHGARVSGAVVVPIEGGATATLAGVF